MASLRLCERGRVREIQVRTILQSWKTFWSLNTGERDIAWTAAAGLTATWLGLRVLGFRRWKQLIARQAGFSVEVQAALGSPGISANRIVKLQAAVVRNLFFKTSCLERSLVLWQLLRRNGFPAELKIGARKETGRFEAHAWVELDGQALNNENHEHREFVPFDSAVTATERHAE